MRSTRRRLVRPSLGSRTGGVRRRRGSGVLAEERARRSGRGAISSSGARREAEETLRRRIEEYFRAGEAPITVDRGAMFDYRCLCIVR